MCIYKEKICMSKAIHLYGSLVPIALLCVILALLIHRVPKGLVGPSAQHSNSSITSMTIVRGPVRIRLLTVR